MDIVLVEDNPADVELTLRALRKHGLANRIHVLRDGAEVIDFVLSNEEIGLTLPDYLAPRQESSP